MQHYFLEHPGRSDEFRSFTYYFGGQAFLLTSNRGIFSHGHVDPCSERLMKTLPALTGSLLDLGCGYGAIGIPLAQRYGLTLTLSDINPRALVCAKTNAEQNHVPAEVIQSDGFDALPGKFQTITLNPPIHAGQAVVFRLCSEAKTHLEPDGRLYIVMLEKHGAKSAARFLAEQYSCFEILYKKKSEFVFSCGN